MAAGNTGVTPIALLSTLISSKLAGKCSGLLRTSHRYRQLTMCKLIVVILIIINMKLKWIIFFMFCAWISLKSQEIEVDWSPKLKTKLAVDDVLFLTERDDKILFLQNGSSISKYIYSYNTQKENISYEKVGFEPERIKLKTILNFRNSIISPWSSFNSDTKKLEIFYSKFNVKNKFEKPRLLYEHEFKNYAPLFSKDIDETKHQDKLEQFCLSIDSTKMVYINSLTAKTKNSRKIEKVILAVFDSNLELLWEKIQELPFKDKEFMITEVFVSNDGQNVYLVGKEKLSKVEDKTKLRMFIINQDEIREHEFELENQKEPLSIFPVEVKNENYIYCGLFKSNQNGYAKGIYIGEYREGKKNILNYVEFSNEEISEFSSMEMLKYGKSLSRNYQTVGCISSGTSHYHFVIESYRVYKTTSNHSGAIEIKKESKGLYFITINENGEIKNNYLLHRKLISYPKQTNVTLFKSADNIFLVYDTKLSMRDMDFYELKKAKRYKFPKLYSFDFNGEKLSDNLLLNSKREKTSFVPHHIISYKHETLRFLCGYSKEIMFGSVNIK